MRLLKARVQNYRSIRDTGWFNVERLKTICVGPNEAGKTAILRALQQLNAPGDVPGFDPLRDYPRASYNDVTTGKVDPSETTVVEAHFALDEADAQELPEAFRECEYAVERRLDNTTHHWLLKAPAKLQYKDCKKDLLRLAAHVDDRAAGEEDGGSSARDQLESIVGGWSDTRPMQAEDVSSLSAWLNQVLPLVEEDSKEEKRHDKLVELTSAVGARVEVLRVLHGRLPVFVLFNNYFRVRPLIHLEHLATRLRTKVLDDDQYDYGNKCLLDLLGFTAHELSNLGKAPDPKADDANALQRYRDQLDKRTYQLNAASLRLTREIRAVWFPDPSRAEADRLRVQADGQYLKVVVEDDLGVEIELDQRSEGFQWLVSFFVVFFAETGDKHKNAVLLLDEPGMSLHGLKQRDFRKTISRLAESNQTLYTTHSPFLVGPDELDLVRVVELTDRTLGTKVHTNLMAGDPAALLPLQEALGYDLAQSLFAQQRNLVLEGITDYWYLEALSGLLGQSGHAQIDPKIAMLPASSAGKVAYYATILHAQSLKVAALLDSDVAGHQAASQQSLVHTLGNKRILRTKDSYSGKVATPEIEDIIRETLISVAAQQPISCDVSQVAAEQPSRPIVDILRSQKKKLSKYELAKAFLAWARSHSADDLTEAERADALKLVAAINRALK